ncbi:hypothetical protein [Photobacterium aquae]|nr:hypothetical protein [Photobacterium aquae]
MFGQAINTIGMCIIGGKYLLMFILAAITLTTGAVQADIAQLAMVEPAE